MSAGPSVLIIVPARLASTRFPGKPLALLRGAGDQAKPLIRWTWEVASRLSDLARVVVATDAPSIADVVTGFGGEVVMTSAARRNGTERCAEALAQLDIEPELVINLQGDSPLVRPGDISALIAASRTTAASVITPYVECDAALADRLLADSDNGRVGGTTLVTDQQDRALYFSKRLLPYRAGNVPPLKLHVGLYAYTPSALRRYANWDPTPLEQAEGLEQLRFLEHGVPIQAVCVPSRPGGFWEVNNPDDIAPVESALAASL